MFLLVERWRSSIGEGEREDGVERGRDDFDDKRNVCFALGLLREVLG